MYPSRSPAAAVRRRTGLTGLLTLSFTAGIAAVAADLSARDVRPLPVALEFAALLAGAGAVRLSRMAADGPVAAEDAPGREHREQSPDATRRTQWAAHGPRTEWAERTAQATRVQQPPSAPLSAPAPHSTPAPQADPWIPAQQRLQQQRPQQSHPHLRRTPRPTAPTTPPPFPATSQLFPAAPPAPQQSAHTLATPAAVDTAAAEDPHAGARRAFVNLARRIQGAVNRQLRDLRELEARHGADPEVFGDLLQVDHATALIGRLADSLAVLGGDPPARRWQRPIPLVSVLRGAMSRITEYRRVEIGPLPDRVGVDGGAVEALVHALAELLDNATRYSPPDTRVRLGARALDGAVLIEVVDAGVGLTQAAAERADLVLRTRDFGLELASLSESPRLGLAVVGRLAQAIGFEASLHPVPDGGLCARLRVPAGLLRELPEADLAPVKPDQRPHSHRAAQPGQPGQPTQPAQPSQPGGARAGSSPTALTAHGLPQRRRRVPNAGAAASGTPDGATKNSNTRTGSGNGTGSPGGAAIGTAAAAAPPAPGLWLSAFQAGLRGESSEGASRTDGRTPE